MNLICCTSPLQIMIAERIIDLYPDEEFYGVVSLFFDSPKARHYCDRLRSRCARFEFVLLDPSQRVRGLLTTARLLTRVYGVEPFERFFLASIDNSIFYLYMHRSPRAEVITFDDGLINLDPVAFESLQIGNSQPGLLSKLLHRWMGVPLASEILQRQSLHYTIYPYPNVMPHARQISLFSAESDPLVDVLSEATVVEGVEVSILMGQPLYGEEQYQRLLRKVYEEYAPGYYAPHPKENFKIEQMEVIHTPLIFEDYILQELRDHPERRYVIYSYCSTSILNLQGIPRLRFVVIKPSDCPEHLLETYNLLERVGMEIHHLDVEA